MNESSVLPVPEIKPTRAVRRLDWQLLLALLLALAVVMPRSWDMSRKLSEYLDDEYHLVRGIRFFTHELHSSVLNDPPLGEAIGALPLYLAGVREIKRNDSVLHNASSLVKPTTRLALVRLGKALLFIPLVGVVFVWLRRLYGARSAWLAGALLIFEPNIAAHIPTPALDVIGMSGIVLSVWTLWRFFDKPTVPRLVVSAVAMAVAMMLKHTALILPGISIGFAILWWWVRPRWVGRVNARGSAELEICETGESPARADFGELSRAGRPCHKDTAGYREDSARVDSSHNDIVGNREDSARVVSCPISAWRALAIAMGVFLVSLWALCLFDFSRPVMPERWRDEDRLVTKLLSWHMPAGMYVGSVCQAMAHGEEGHTSYLFGQQRAHGWWYYFAVVGWYKAPIGVALVIALDIASLVWIKPRWDEWSLLLPMIAWTVFLVSSGINIGIRHFLPAYVFILLLACRCVSGRGIGWTIAAWVGVALAAVHGLSYHPNYISYFNFPRDKPYLSISDSNVDWGQSLVQVKRWLQQHPPGARSVAIRSMTGVTPERKRAYLPEYVQILSGNMIPPRGGLLIVSPVREAGLYERVDRYAPLRKQKPIVLIGNCMPIYDLDRIAGWKKYIDELRRKSRQDRAAATTTAPAGIAPEKP